MGFAWASGTASDAWLAAALWSALLAWSSALLLVCSIAALRVTARLRSARSERRLARWRPVLAAVIAGDDPPAHEPAAAELRDVLALWNQHAVAVKGPARERLAAWARGWRLEERAATLLERGSVRDRLLALATLGHLADRAYFILVLVHARLADPLVSLAAARALIAMDGAEAFVALRRELLEREDWPVARLLAAFREHRSERLAGLFADALEQASGPRLTRMLQLAQAVPQERIAAQLRRVLESDAERETLVAALKLLADPRDAPLARRYAAHGEWVVRLAAVRALGRIATKPDLPVLCGALADPVWWVRQRAADAIVGLPYLTAPQLKLLQTIVADRFGADALARALAEKKLS
jgi:HEAT repeat protein